MSCKTVVVTGATNGIGKETARELARMGATTLIVGRNPQKGARVVAELQADTGNARVEFLLADLSLQHEVRELAAQIRSRHGRLDVLVNNAGTVLNRREVTAEGIEKTWALNHLSYFLLTLLLLDLLEASPGGRVVNVASSSHRQGKIDFEDVQAERKYHGFRRYGTTKLANVLFTNELARRLDGSGVTVNAAHPGLVPENFPIPESWGRRRVALFLFRPWSKTSAQGARTSLYLATSPEVAGVTGGYFVDCRPLTPSKDALDAALARKVWDLSARQTGVEAASAE
jgi:NAD(P)-dependent dehydrogenase (short-subunit alcohol dehydrogenase family)